MYFITFGQDLHIRHSRAMHGRAMQRYTERRRSPVIYALFFVLDKVACRSVAQADRHADLFLPAVELFFLGPLVVRLISDAMCNICYTFFFLVLMVWLAVPILLSVNLEQGRTDARNYHAKGYVDESEL